LKLVDYLTMIIMMATAFQLSKFPGNSSLQSLTNVTTLQLELMPNCSKKTQKSTLYLYLCVYQIEI